MSLNANSSATVPIGGRVQLDNQEFIEFRDYLQNIAGIDLGHNKQYLVATRIRRILIDYECNSLAELTKEQKREIRTVLDTVIATVDAIVNP